MRIQTKLTFSGFLKSKLFWPGIIAVNALSLGVISYYKVPPIVDEYRLQDGLPKTHRTPGKVTQNNGWPKNVSVWATTTQKTYDNSISLQKDSAKFIPSQYLRALADSLKTSPSLWQAHYKLQTKGINNPWDTTLTQYPLSQPATYCDGLDFFNKHQPATRYILGVLGRTNTYDDDFTEFFGALADEGLLKRVVKAGNRYFPGSLVDLKQELDSILQKAVQQPTQQRQELLLLINGHGSNGCWMPSWAKGNEGDAKGSIELHSGEMLSEDQLKSWLKPFEALNIHIVVIPATCFSGSWLG